MKRKNFWIAMTCACALSVGAASVAVMAEETEFDEAAVTDDTIAEDETETAAEEVSEDSTETGSEDAGEDETDMETEAETEAERPTYTALDYVELGEYVGLTVQVEPVEVTEEDVLAEAEELISYSDAVETLTEGTVQEGDTVDIYYVGTMDGEEFDGGSGDYELEIGSGTFIDGFEEGLIGVEVGETVEIDLTFPEDYYYAAIAGQDVVFTVTVNGILSIPELTDEVVDTATEGEYTDVDSWLAYIREYLEEDAVSEEEYYVQEGLYEALAAGSEITAYPEELVDYSVSEAVAYYELLASYYSMEYEDLIAAMFEMEEDTFLEYLDAMVRDSLQEELLLMAVAEAESMELTDEEYEAGLAQLAEDYGYDSGADMEADYGETEMRRYILMDKVFDFLEENAVIEEVEETEMETEYETGDAEAETDTDAVEAETAAEDAEASESDVETEDTEAPETGAEDAAEETEADSAEADTEA
ncbi:MAG: trigger factor [Lachnospiraceae bacterium]|nr:trigger factor [Lachnospiraceae bacterium]